MKIEIEIEIPQEMMEAELLRASKGLIATESWSPGKLVGDMACELRREMRNQISAQIQALDLTAEIKTILAEHAIPRIRDAVKRELAAEAKRAVKAAMDERK